MTLKAAELIGLAVVAVLIGAALVYLLGSFFLMARYVDPRPGQHQITAMLRELYYVLLTQPLIPFYFVFGRKMGPGNGIPVIFVHGYFQNRADFWWMAKQFRKASKGPLYGFNYPWFDTVENNSPRLAGFVARVCAETGAQQVTLVAHSLGGLVCLDYAHSPGGRPLVAHCITVGTPHGGVKWRGPILGKVADDLREGGALANAQRDRPVELPTLSVYSTHDNIVHPPSTSELAPRGGNDVAVEGLGHLSLLYSPEVTRVLIEFIENADDTDGKRPPATGAN